MNKKYFTNGKLDFSDLKHDIASLVEPLAMSIGFVNSGKTDKALFLQQEILKNLKSIIESLNSVSEPSERKT